MLDEERRLKERRAKMGDEASAAEINREDARRGSGVVGFLQDLIGKTVWIEGVRINYRGTLVEILRNADDSVAALVLFPFQRVSYFKHEGVDRAYTFDHAKPHMVPYECIHDVGEDGILAKSDETGWGIPTSR